MAEANLRWKADTAEAIAKTEALKRVVASVGGSSTTSAIRNLGSAWKIVVPAIAAAGVAVLGLTGNLATLAPLLPVVTIALTGLLVPFTTLAAIIVGFIPPLTLLAGLLGGLGVAFGLAGVRALKGGGIFKDLADIVEKVDAKFHDLIYTLGRDFLPIFTMLAKSALTALTYLGKIAQLPLKQAFQSLSTTGVAGLQKFLDHIGKIVARPIRLAFQVAFGKSSTLRNALVDDWNDIVNFFIGHKGVALPVEKWFGKQNFTKVGYRWASEVAGAFMTGLGIALRRALSTRGGQMILGGGAAGAGIGLAIGGPMGAAVGAAMGVAIGVELNHYWPRITAAAGKAFHAVGAFLKRALGPQLWGDIISSAQSFWDTLKSIAGYIQNHILPVVRHVFAALGGWHTVGLIIIGVVRGIVGAFTAVANMVRIVYNAIQTVVHWIQRAANVANGALQGAFSGVLSAVGAVSSAIGGIVSGIQTAVSWATALKNALGGGGVPKGIHTTGRSPPPTAAGGIFTSPQVRLIGEAGPEAVIPLTGSAIRIRDVMDKMWRYIGPKIWPGYTQPPAAFKNSLSAYGQEAGGEGWNGPGRHVAFEKGILSWLTQKNLAKKYWLSRAASVELVLHEWAHAFQNKRTWASKAEREGGAEMFALGALPSVLGALGWGRVSIPANQSTYPGFLHHVENLHDKMWSVFGQFVHRKYHTLGTREKFARMFAAPEFRASGGPVFAGRGYVVGERGPELFTPSSGGRITPNGGQPIQVNLVLDRKVLTSVLVDAEKTYRRQNAGRSLFAV